MWSVGVVERMLKKARELESADTVQSIPDLAVMEKEAPGFLSIILSALLGFAWSMTGLWIVFLFLFRFTPAVIRLTTVFFEGFYPGWERFWPFMVLAAGLTALVINLIHNPDAVRQPVMMRFSAFEGRQTLLARAFAAVASSLLIITALPIFLFGLMPALLVPPRLFYWIQSVLEPESRARLVDYANSGFSPMLTMLVILAFTLWVIFRFGMALFRTNPELLKAPVTLLWIVGIWIAGDCAINCGIAWQTALPPQPVIYALAPYAALTEITGNFYRLAEQGVMMWRSSTPAIMLSMAGLVSLYPLGLSRTVTSAGTRPFFNLVETVDLLSCRLLLRYRINRGVRHHTKRNRYNIGERIWTTVCRTDRARFKSYTERRRGLRWVSYGCCPVCRQDNDAWKNVESIALLFDKPHLDEPTQKGETLYLDGYRELDQLDPDKVFSKKEILYDAVVIANAESADIEQFLIRYQGLEHHKLVSKPLSQLHIRLTPEVALNPSVFAMLEEEGRDIQTGFDHHKSELASTPQTVARYDSRARTVEIRYLISNLLYPVKKILVRGVFLAFLFGLVRGVFWWRADDRAIHDLPLVSLFFNQSTENSTEETQPGSDINPLQTTLEAPEDTVTDGEMVPTKSPTLNAGLPTVLTDKDGMTLLPIAAGPFQMGNPVGNIADRTADEAPQRTITLSAYYIDAFAITQEQYALCVSDNSCPAVPVPENSENDWPVVNVTWENAATYCAWAGRRLPTEAEWEKAARWDPDTGAVREFPWGDQMPTKAYVNYNRITRHPLSVTAFPEGRSATGAWQMSGNVWEWVSDWYEPLHYQTMSEQDPQGPSRGRLRSARGGAWDSTAFQIRGTNRYELPPNTRRDNLGFRCATNALPLTD